jgi:predicted  nucleic acid-binding Zn-ribbon protein
MKGVNDSLMALQELECKSTRPVVDRDERRATLRAGIPEAFLRTFDRFISRDKKPVSIVRNGVCSECHLQVAIGVVGALASSRGVEQCGNCGRFLFLSGDPPVNTTEPQSKAGRSPSRRKSATP